VQRVATFLTWRSDERLVAGAGCRLPVLMTDGMAGLSGCPVFVSGAGAGLQVVKYPASR
jgi:hypothetical protein